MKTPLHVFLILSLITFNVSRGFSETLEKPKVIFPGKQTNLPNCQGNLVAKIGACVKYKCLQDMAMGLKGELFIHGFASNQKDCLISTPNQKLKLSKEDLSRLSNYYAWLDQGQVVPDENLLSGSKTYKFKNFSCRVDGEDVYDTKGFQEAKGQCTDIVFINKKGYCSRGQPLQVKYTRLKLVEQKSDPKCKAIDFNIFEDLWNKGLIENMQPEMEQ